MLTNLVGSFVVANRLGNIYAAETACVVARNPETVRGAGFSFIRRERLSQIADTEYAVRIASEIGAEVLTPNNRPGVTAEKVEQWVAFSVGLLWVVDPTVHPVTVYRPGTLPVVLPETAEVDAKPILPGFRLRIVQVYE